MSDVNQDCEKKNTMMTDDFGNPSIMRFGFLIGIFMAVCITSSLLYGKLFKNIQITAIDVSLIISWLTPAFGGKIWQKFIENK
jgi:hypothetical protein